MDENKLYSDPEENVEDEEQGMFEHFRLNVDPGQSPMRIDKFMATHLEDTSRHRVQLAIKEGYVKVGEKTAKANLIVRPGDIIRFMMPYRRRGTEIIPQDIPLDIVYEDDDLLVVNKPAGMVVHPGHGNYDGTLVNALAFHLGIDPAAIQEQGPAEPERMGILVHRIDKDTSGLLLVAKNEESQVVLAKQFFEHTIERKYNALVWGSFNDMQGTIVGNLERSPSDRRVMHVTTDPDRGKHAVTHWNVLEQFGYVTLVECVLETGRTHQIRAHMQHIGHPLFNDAAYGGDRILKGTTFSKYKQFVENCFTLLPRQALHALVLGFDHPTTGRHLHFEAPIPADMASVLDKWRNYSHSAMSE